VVQVERLCYCDRRLPSSRSAANCALMRSMVMEFRSIVRHGRTEALEGWLRKARDSDIYSFRRFAKTLRRDLTAVQNALREPFSSGPVEGQINWLKTLKRQMYGRAGFALLRARLLPPATLDSQMVHQT
jgi:transposase